MGSFQESILRKMKIKNCTVFFNITNRCNAHCRHCINIGGKTVLGEAEPEDVLKWIEGVAESSYKAINFVGGEPFLLMDDIKRYTKRAYELGLNPGITTNGFWAKSVEEAIDILTFLPALRSILVSTDIYHLEFIGIENIHNLIQACLRLNRFIAINATCANRAEGEMVKKLFSEYHNKIFINISAIMPAGAALKLDNQLEKFDYFDGNEKITDFCGVRDHFVDCQGGVTACCMATLGLNTKFLYLGNLNINSFSEILRKRESNHIYKFLEEKGPRGLAFLILDSPYASIFRNRKYSSECGLCVEILNHPECYGYILKRLSGKGNGHET